GGGTLTVSSVGMFATALNAGIEYSGGPRATTLFSFQIDADTEKPVIHRVSPSKNVLSPPNHKMVPVTLTVSATDDREVASIRIVNVTSNEAPYRKGRGNGREKGHGNRPVDWQLTGGLTLQLRAERTG